MPQTHFACCWKRDAAKKTYTRASASARARTHTHTTHTHTQPPPHIATVTKYTCLSTGAVVLLSHPVPPFLKISRGIPVHRGFILRRVLVRPLLLVNFLGLLVVMSNLLNFHGMPAHRCSMEYQYIWEGGGGGVFLEEVPRILIKYLFFASAALFSLSTIAKCPEMLCNFVVRLFLSARPSIPLPPPSPL